LVTKKGAYPLYFFYKLKSMLSQTDSLSYGTVFDTITKKTFDELKFCLPSENEQRAIASILEAIGQALFKRWFVDFEFPDGEGKPYRSSGGEMVETELGEVPKGWRAGTVADLCVSITNGGTPKRMENRYWKDGTIPWYKTGELFDEPLLDSEEHITEEGLKESSCHLWEPDKDSWYCKSSL
jgi:type I restriction enzyme S subunit